MGQVIAVVGVVVGAFGAVIAFLKWRRDEFHRQHKERREIYEATRKILYDVFHDGISEDAIREYRFRTLDAKFLFDEEMASYLAELCQQITLWYHAKLKSNQDEYKRIAHEALQWIIAQGDEHTGFDVRFRSYL